MDLQCPACDAPLDEAGRTYRCRLCEGAWVTEDTVVAILEQRASALVELPWKPREDEKHRPCAECKTAMQTVDLGKVQLDRCPSHGVWFDADELAALLREAKHFATHDAPAGSGEREQPRHGLLGKLAKLFGG